MEADQLRVAAEAGEEDGAEGGRVEAPEATTAVMRVTPGPELSHRKMKRSTVTVERRR